MDSLEEILRKQYHNFDPDHLHDEPSITFLIDKRTGKLYSEPFPATHEDIVNQTIKGSYRGDFRDDPEYGTHIDPNFTLGRVGYLYYEKEKLLPKSYANPESSKIVAIGFWNRNISPKEISSTINTVKTAYPEYFTEDFIVIGDHGNGVPFQYIKGSGGPGITHEEEPEPCKKLGVIQIQSKNMTLPQILSQLHMAKAQDLDYLKSGFCAQYPTIKTTSQKTGCPQQVKMLDYISNKLKCGQEDYKTALQAGRMQYRQNLKSIFSNPEKIGKEFRTQKEIDQAWDELMKGKKAYENFSFKEWLKSK